MKHELNIKYRIKYVWLGVILMIIGGIVLFASLDYYDIYFGVREVIIYVAGVSATMTLFYHAFSLEYQINTQNKNLDLQRAKYTYDILSQWTSPEMRECVNEVRNLLITPAREKELNDITKIQDFAEYLKKNQKDRSYLVQTLNYFETISTMIETKHIDLDIVKKTFKSLFVSYYLVLKNYIDFRQKEYPDSWMYYEKICKIWIEDNKTA
ncbi:DUF4760 domain-containing protein [Aureitalea sp. L0-47]|uniref:DUF4760 domain-containing protein n=1 Tax=Aureitalea sp. L0-47 TaxID=2816962 RepID=UPI002237DA7D|nr:DUF4760 domain-containing protein [Aureitalea sp. L0-47]MCW5518215.1 DUF4760 domain-containing protein [Aureitalea sp. L0-47]